MTVDNEHVSSILGVISIQHSVELSLRMLCVNQFFCYTMLTCLNRLYAPFQNHPGFGTISNNVDVYDDNGNFIPQMVQNCLVKLDLWKF